VHELCHLKAMHHGPSFWALVAEQVPEYQAHRRELRRLEQVGISKLLQ
jgi:predicted metal-dependent hydrolase